MTNSICTVSTHLLILRIGVLSFLFSVYSCALLRDILLQGRLYISRNWLCFYANLFGKDIKVWMTDRHLYKLTWTALNWMTQSPSWQLDKLCYWKSITIISSQLLLNLQHMKISFSVCLHCSTTSDLTEPLTRYVVFSLMYCELFLFLHFLETKPLLTLSDNKLLIQTAFLTFWLK